MSDNEKIFEEISRKLTALLSLTLRNLIKDQNFSNKGKQKKGTGDLANYLADFGLDAKDIAKILGAPVRSIRTMLTPRRRKK